MHDLQLVLKQLVQLVSFRAFVDCVTIYDLRGARHSRSSFHRQEDRAKAALPELSPQLVIVEEAGGRAAPCLSLRNSFHQLSQLR